MKKILELFGEPFFRGGQEAFVMNVIQNIDYTDLKIDFCTPYQLDSEDYSRIIKEKNGNIFAFNLPFNPGGMRFDLFNPVFNLLKSNRYDVVHIHSGSIMALAVLSFAAKVAGVKKIIVHSHATGIQKDLKHNLSKLICSPALAICPTDYFACSAEAAEWKFSKRIVKNKVKIIKNGIDLEKFRPDNETRIVYRKKLGYSDNEKVIGHVGRFSEEKNHRFIIDLFTALRQESNRYKLLLLGDGELKSSIEEYAKSKGVYDEIVFTGNVNNVQDYMQAMDLFVLPSKFEGLGIVGVEAQACGLPCVFSEGVPQEAKLTTGVKLISLDKKTAWKNDISVMIDLDKTNNSKVLKDSGYDIIQTTKMIRDVYIQ